MIYFPWLIGWRMLQTQKGSLGAMSGFSRETESIRDVYDIINLPLCMCVYNTHGIPQWLRSEESTCNAGVAGDTGLIPGSGRSPGGRHGNPLQFSCLENPMNRGVWQVTGHEISKSWTQLKQLSVMHAYACTQIHIYKRRLIIEVGSRDYES